MVTYVVSGTAWHPSHFRGPWDSATTYAADDVVTYGGSSYVALAPSTNLQPDTYPTLWGLLASGGAAGPTGPTGPTGPMGPTGPTGAAGPSGVISVTAPITNSGTPTAANIGIANLTDASVAAANKDGVAGTASLRTLGAGAQQAAAGNDSRLSDARTPTAHASTHNAGGSDVLAIDAAAGTGSLRTLGTAGTQAAPGNDARFPDSILTTLGDILYRGGSAALRLAGNTLATRKFLRQTGTGAASAAPVWDTLLAADIPALAYVTSVGLTMPAEFSVAGSPVTSSGTIAVTKANQSAGQFYGGPVSGAAAAPAFRAFDKVDFNGMTAASTFSPTLSQGGANIGGVPVQADYMKIGHLVFFFVQFNPTAAGTAGSNIIVGGFTAGGDLALPTAGALVGTFQYFDSGTDRYTGVAQVRFTQTELVFIGGKAVGTGFFGATPNFAIASGDSFQISGFFVATT